MKYSFSSRNGSLSTPSREQLLEEASPWSRNTGTHLAAYFSQQLVAVTADEAAATSSDWGAAFKLLDPCVGCAVPLADLTAVPPPPSSADPLIFIRGRGRVKRTRSAAGTRRLHPSPARRLKKPGWRAFNQSKKWSSSAKKSAARWTDCHAPSTGNNAAPTPSGMDRPCLFSVFACINAQFASRFSAPKPRLITVYLPKPSNAHNQKRAPLSARQPPSSEKRLCPASLLGALIARSQYLVIVPCPLPLPCPVRRRPGTA